MLCSHLKIAPSCRRFPPQTRGEHLRRRSTGEPRQRGGGCFHNTRTRWHCATQIPLCTAPSLGVPQLQDVTGTPGNCPVTPANSFLLQPPMHCPGVLGAEACSQEALVPAELCLYLSHVSYKHRNLGRVYNYLFCFFLYYPATKILYRSRMFVYEII